MPAIMGHLKNGTAQGGGDDRGPQRSISFTSDQQKSEQNTEPATAESRKKQKKCRDLSARTAICWLATEMAIRDNK